MFRKTFTGSLLAASLTAGALLSMPAAHATPSWVGFTTPSQSGLLPQDAKVAMSENGNAVATWVRSVGGKDRVQASYYAKGTWSAPANVSLADEVVKTPNVAINDAGAAIVSWLQADDNSHFQIVTNRFANGAFGVSKQVTQGNTYTAGGEYDVALDAAGSFWAGYQVSNEADINLVRVIRHEADTSSSQWTLGDESSFAPDLSVNSKGEAVLAFYNAGNGSSTIDVRRLPADSGTWSATKSVGINGQYLPEAETGLGDDGSATVAYVVKDNDGDFRVAANRVNTDGTLGTGAFVSNDNVDVSSVSLAQNDNGTAQLSWYKNAEKEIGFATRYGTLANWTNIGWLSDNVVGPTRPQSAISDSGMIVIGFADNGHQRAAWQEGFSSMTQFDTGAAGFVTGQTSVGIDNQGNALLGGIIKSGNPANGQVQTVFLDGAGPVTTTTAPVTSLSTTVKVSRTSVDRFSAIGKGSIRVRTARWDGDFSAPQIISSNTTATSINFVGKPGYTYCFSSRAGDAHGTVGLWSPEKCTTVALDDRNLFNAKKFKHVKAGSAYQGTISKSRTKGAKLIMQHLNVRKVAIVVNKSSKGGKVKVSFGGKKLGTYSLKGKGTQQVINVKDFGTVRNGTLVIKVISKTGKKVRIDAVIASR